ncbi:MAG: hypothetical protein HYZ25_18300 [Chloroflexi bacterium]|nr:hypothetical protein [Chloroflexota bacterium]
MKRKRGAQFGNRNAFKHGLYSAHFKQAERERLSRIQGTDLSNEIGLIRVDILRYLEAETLAAGQIDYETRLQALRAVSLAAESITRLVRTQLLLNSDPPAPQADQESPDPVEELNVPPA